MIVFTLNKLYNIIMSLAEVVTKLRLERGWLKRELAEKTGLEESHISRIESGDFKEARPPTRRKLASAFNLSVEEFTQMIYASDSTNVPLPNDKTDLQFSPNSIKLIPVLGFVPAGIPFPPEENVAVSYLPVQLSQLAGLHLEGLYGLLIKGDSLIGDGIEDGDVVVIDPKYVFSNGKIYVVQLQNDVVVRHVSRHDGHLRLYSSNDKYEEIKDTEAAIKGRVVLSGKPYKKH